MFRSFNESAAGILTGDIQIQGEIQLELVTQDIAASAADTPQATDARRAELSASPTPTDIDTCVMAPPPRLQPGDAAMQIGAENIRMRDAPGLGTEEIGRIPRQEQVHVVNGPRCADGFHWFKVVSEDNRQGWVAEADNTGAKEYWLVKVVINTDTPAPTTTPTDAPTATNTDTPAPTATFTATPTESGAPAASDTPTAANADTPDPTDATVPTDSPGATFTDTSAPTDQPTATSTFTPTDTPTATFTPTPTWTDTPTATFTSTPTWTDTATATFTATSTPTDTPTATSTDTPTDTPTATNTPAPCQFTPPPQLAPGDSALQLGASFINLRREPGLNARVITRIRRNDRVDIVARRQCVDELYWYQVVTNRGHQGWVAEADNGALVYWLVLAADDTACALEPRFAPGDTANSKPGRALNVRVAPHVSADETDRDIEGGESVEVLGGPVCADSYIWYRVRNEALGIAGWVAEGGASGYWFYAPER